MCALEGMTLVFAGKVGLKRLTGWGGSNYEHVLLSWRPAAQKNLGRMISRSTLILA